MSIQLQPLHRTEGMCITPQSMQDRMGYWGQSERDVLYEVRAVDEAPGLEWNVPVLVQPTDITRTQYTKCRLWHTSWGWASNVRNM
jgi:hypothetical protein